MIIEKEDRNFLILISIFVLTLFLTFIFFYPKFDIEKENNLEFTSNISIDEEKNIILKNIKEGDLILSKPSSLPPYYSYLGNKNKDKFNNIFFFFFYYNLFDKILIRSMGEHGYWHVSIYTGNSTLNSLSIVGVEQEKLNELFMQGHYLKILRISTKDEIKLKAIQNANNHLKRQDIYYSLKNGLFVVFAYSLNLNYISRLDENRLVCSSYIALLYRDISFNPKKHYDYITPNDIEDSDLVRVILITEKEGLYYAG